MAEVLVLVDHVDGKVRKTTYELLTIARRLGEPSAVFIGPASTPPRTTLAEYGAEKVYVVERAEVARATSSPRRPRCSRSWSRRRRRPRCSSRPPPRARRSPPGSRSRPSPA